jgi:hypothetical protein
MHLNPVAAELNAKITAKNNTKMKQNQPKSYHKSQTPSLLAGKQDPYAPYAQPDPKPESNLLDLKIRPHQHITDNADVESRLSASKISVSAFKSFHASQLPMAGPDVSPMLAMNLGRHLGYHHHHPNQ